MVFAATFGEKPAMIPPVSWVSHLKEVVVTALVVQRAIELVAFRWKLSQGQRSQGYVQGTKKHILKGKAGESLKKVPAGKGQYVSFPGVYINNDGIR